MKKVLWLNVYKPLTIWAKALFLFYMASILLKTVSFYPKCYVSFCKRKIGTGKNKKKNPLLDSVDIKMDSFISFIYFNIRAFQAFSNDIYPLVHSFEYSKIFWRRPDKCIIAFFQKTFYLFLYLLKLYRWLKKHYSSFSKELFVIYF